MTAEEKAYNAWEKERDKRAAAWEKEDYKKEASDERALKRLSKMFIPAYEAAYDKKIEELDARSGNLSDQEYKTESEKAFQEELDAENQFTQQFWIYREAMHKAMLLLQYVFPPELMKHFPYDPNWEAKVEAIYDEYNPY